MSEDEHLAREVEALENWFDRWATIQTVRPQFVTFTGVDEKADLPRLCELSHRYPIEWGVLFGGRLGNNRYAPAATVERLGTLGLSLSAHLCGNYARRALTGELSLDLSPFTRVQINAVSYTIDAMERFQTKIGKPVLMQHRKGEFPELPDGLFALHDQSGGKGILPTSRPAQSRSHPNLVGYAGGLGPKNVAEVVSQIIAHAYWIDMETQIRTDDWLDLDKCEAVCQQIWPDQID